MGLEIEIGIETSPGVNSQMFAAATLAAAAAEAEPRSDHSVRERERERVRPVGRARNVFRSG